MKNKLKLFFCSIFILLCFSQNIFSLGAGFQLSVTPISQWNLSQEEDNYKNVLDCSLAGTIRFFRLPAQFSLGLELKEFDSVFHFGPSASFDYFFVEKQLYNTTNLVIGTGINGSILFNKNNIIEHQLGLKLIFGLSRSYLDGYVEPYGLFSIDPTYAWHTNSEDCFLIKYPIDIGLRFHF